MTNNIIGLAHVVCSNILHSRFTATYPHTSTWCSSLGTTKAGKLSGAKEAGGKSKGKSGFRTMISLDK